MKAINLDGHNEYNIEEVDGDYKMCPRRPRALDSLELGGIEK